MEKVHFIGAAGAGVSALAQFHVMQGGLATGSDRMFDRGGAAKLRRQLEKLGVVICPQDGSSLDGSHAYAVASAAVEDDNADISRAKQMGLRILHRADCLADHVARHRTIAVAGTSGKSTVVAMIYEILESAGVSPCVITGGALLSLEQRGYVGNAFKGKSDIMVIEADESDGTLTKYRPWLGVLLNMSKDHKDPAELMPIFSAFRSNSSSFAVRAGPPFEDIAKGSVTFGLEQGEVRVDDMELGPEGSRFKIAGQAFTLPVPGRHNVENAVAAVAACRQAGVRDADSARALAKFQGVARRLQRVGSAQGIEVIDDFAHNPVKVAASLAAGRLKSPRILAVFQLHGFAPARLMKTEFIETFSSSLLPEDVLWMPEIYYAGGTAAKDISAKNIVDEVASRGKNARFALDRAAIITEIIKTARSGDLVLVMGARDPSLSGFAKDILYALSSSSLK